MQVVFTAFSLRSRNKPEGTERERESAQQESESKNPYTIGLRFWHAAEVCPYIVRPAVLSMHFTWFLLALSKVALRR